VTYAIIVTHPMVAQSCFAPFARDLDATGRDDGAYMLRVGYVARMCQEPRPTRAVHIDVKRSGRRNVAHHEGGCCQYTARKVGEAGSSVV
jgi:hypothetical protein